MEFSTKCLLADRIAKHCITLYDSGHFKSAAFEALLQVERALKEKARLGNDSFGRGLIQKVFKGHQGVILKVPLGDDQQEKAQKYFEGVFSYYRNYLAHDGSKIDQRSSLRIMIIASELLELLTASSLTLTDHGGVGGVVRVVGCENHGRLNELLRFLDGYWMPELTYDGLFERLYEKGFHDNHLENLIEFGLIEMLYFNDPDPYTGKSELMERFVLTNLGHDALEASNLLL